MKVIIVELSTSHEECIYAQVLFLKHAGIETSLLLHKALEQQVSSYETLCKSVDYIHPLKKGAFRKIRQQVRTAQKLKQYDLVIFNTASSSKFVRNLCLLLLTASVPCVGVLHNGNKLLKSFTQRIISLKIKKYMVLSDQIKDYLSGKTAIEVSSFYPIFFPDYKSEITKPKEDVWIAIPGRIDWQRRDYMILINALSKLKHFKNLKFLLLGKLDTSRAEEKELWEAITKNDLQNAFLCFNSFIANEEYHGYIKASDFILPLLKSEDNYLKYKISGSFNLAYAYKKPLLCKQFFEPLEDLKENAIFYPGDELDKLLFHILDDNMVLPEGYTNPKWSFKYQQANYMEFLDL